MCESAPTPNHLQPGDRLVDLSEGDSRTSVIKQIMNHSVNMRRTNRVMRYGARGAPTTPDYDPADTGTRSTRFRRVAGDADFLADKALALWPDEVGKAYQKMKKGHKCRGFMYWAVSFEVRPAQPPKRDPCTQPTPPWL